VSKKGQIRSPVFVTREKPPKTRCGGPRARNPEGQKPGNGSGLFWTPYFWTKAHPKLKRGEKLDYSSLTQEQILKLRAAVDAIERFVNFAAIALGILEYLALTNAPQVWQSYRGWLRTYSSEIPSEGVVQNVLRAEKFDPAELCSLSWTGLGSRRPALPRDSTGRHELTTIHKLSIPFSNRQKSTSKDRESYMIPLQ